MLILPNGIITKEWRIDHFFKIIKRLNKRFDNAVDAYEHIRKFLDKVEDKYATSNRMFICPFSSFSFHESVQLYAYNSNRQTILISPAGAYGIFQNEDIDRFMDFEYYREASTKILHIPNKHNLTLWCSTAPL